jgi:hypothetical protein
MIARRRGTKKTEPDPTRMAQLLEDHRAAIFRRLEQLRNFELLKIPFGELVQAPERFIPDYQLRRERPIAKGRGHGCRSPAPELHRNPAPSPSRVRRSFFTRRRFCDNKSRTVRPFPRLVASRRPNA